MYFHNSIIRKKFIQYLNVTKFDYYYFKYQIRIKYALKSINHRNEYFLKYQITLSFRSEVRSWQTEK
nr:MAG TPA: hypothetical protein [Caudoviricetes sp.]